MNDGPKADQNGGRVFRIVVKRHDATDGSAPFASPLEALRFQLLDVWSAKGDGSHTPSWLASSEGLRSHLQSVLGADFDFGFDSSTNGHQDNLQAAGGAVNGGIFETNPGGAVIDLSGLPFNFVPEFLDVPSQFG